jgi:hypothetical protein
MKSAFDRNCWDVIYRNESSLIAALGAFVANPIYSIYSIAALFFRAAT